MIGEVGNSIGSGGCGADVLKWVYNWAEPLNIPVLQWTFLPAGTSDPDTNYPSTNSCSIPSILTRWPGFEGDLAVGEHAKDTRDATPDNTTDDATWAGCLNWAYLHPTLNVDWTSISDSDPGSPSFGDCEAYDWEKR